MHRDGSGCLFDAEDMRRSWFEMVCCKCADGDIIRVGGGAEATVRLLHSRSMN
jgi:hypothetical protein